MRINRVFSASARGLFLLLLAICQKIIIFVFQKLIVINSMPAPKGNKNSPNGRGKGTKNVASIRKNMAWAELGDFFTNAGAERAAKIMMTCTDAEFMRYYQSLLEYFKPKQARTENYNTELTATPEERAAAAKAAELQLQALMADPDKLTYGQ